MFLMKMFQLVLGTLVTFLPIISKHVLSYVAVVLVALFRSPEWCLWNVITLMFMAWSLARNDHTQRRSSDSGAG
jgi:hypothetical protein